MIILVWYIWFILCNQNHKLAISKLIRTKWMYAIFGMMLLVSVISSLIAFCFRRQYIGCCHVIFEHTGKLHALYNRYNFHAYIEPCNLWLLQLLAVVYYRETKANNNLNISDISTVGDRPRISKIIQINQICNFQIRNAHVDWKFYGNIIHND